MIKQHYLALTLIFFCTQLGYSCSCAIPKDLLWELNSYNQIFLGKVLSIDTITEINHKRRYQIEYTFTVRKKWKGEINEEIKIYSGYGGGDCGMKFEQDKIYIIYATENETNRCTRSCLYETSTDERLLNHIFLGEKINLDYDSYDKTRISNRLGSIPIDLSQKTITVVKNYKHISKMDFYREHPMYSDFDSELIELTPNEKMKIGDCIDLVYIIGYTRRNWKRKKIIRRLKKGKICK